MSASSGGHLSFIDFDSFRISIFDSGLKLSGDMVNSLLSEALSITILSPWTAMSETIIVFPSLDLIVIIFACRSMKKQKVKMKMKVVIICFMTLGFKRSCLNLSCMMAETRLL